MKTAISLPDPLFTAAEQYAEEKGMTRSELYAQALAYYLRTHHHAGVTEALNRIYAEEHEELDPALHRAQVLLLQKEDW